LDLSITQIALKLAGTGEEIAETGFYVKSEPPGAMVYLDNNFQGNSPITITVEEIREYIIKVESQGYQPWQQKAAAKEDEVVGINAQLVKSIESNMILNPNTSILNIKDIEAYNSSKKDGVNAFVLSVIPGFGHFYAKQNYLGSFFLLGRLASLLYLANSVDGDEMNQNWSLIVFIGSGALDMFSAPFSVQIYNNKLKQKYNISLHPMLDNDGNTQMAFTIEF